MEDYKVIKLKNNCIKEFKFIAKIHDYIFSKDKINYVADYKKIDGAVKALSNKGKDYSNLCYVAMYNEQIIGYIWLQKDERRALKIISIWTLEEFRNQGIAASLCKHASVIEHDRFQSLSFAIDETVKEDIATMLSLKLNSKREQWAEELVI